MRAVVFDLWDTLVPYPAAESSGLYRDLAARLGADERRFVELKPDPRIFGLAADRLGVSPVDCLYVGDGANDELNGAQQVGMRSVQLRIAGKEAWPGASVASLEQVLDLA